MSDAIVHKICTSFENGERVVFCAIYVFLLKCLKRIDNNM